MDILRPNLKYKQLPWQKAATDARKRGVQCVGLYGGIQSGKSWWLIHELWDSIIKISNGRGWIVVPDFGQMGGTQELLETDIVPGEFYNYWKVHHDKIKKAYTFRNGYKLWYKTGERPDDCRAGQVDDIAIDEASQITEEHYNILRGRIITRKGRMMYATTPRGTAHWTNRIWKQKMLEGSPDYFVATGSTPLNIHIPQEERDKICKVLEGKWAARELYGECVDFVGLVYDSFNPGRDFYSFLPNKSYQWFAGIDFGFPKPNGYLLIARSVENVGTPENIRMETVYWVEDEIYTPQTMPEEFAGMIADKEKGYTQIKSILRYADCKDPKNRVLLAASKFRINTIPAKQEKGDLMRGIRKSYDLFKQGRVKINKANCPHLINELLNYAYKEGTESPIDEFDHLLDPLRYTIYGQEGHKTEGVKHIPIVCKPFARIDI